MCKCVHLCVCECSLLYFVCYLLHVCVRRSIFVQPATFHTSSLINRYPHFQDQRSRISNTYHPTLVHSPVNIQLKLTPLVLALVVVWSIKLWALRVPSRHSPLPRHWADTTSQLDTVTPNALWLNQLCLIRWTPATSMEVIHGRVYTRSSPLLHPPSLELNTPTHRVRPRYRNLDLST